jgi:uncharacterized protein YlxP (DUF503 family)
MIIGMMRLQFRLHGNDSLKGKRRVAQSLKQKLRATFNVSVSEVEAQESHETLVLALVSVAPDGKKVESRFSKALAMVEAISPAELVDVSTELFSET